MPRPPVGYCQPVTEATQLDDQADQAPLAAEPESRPEPELITYAEFGEAFMHQVLHLDRILECIDRALGDEIRLGPMGAGPGRKIATLTAQGRFRPSRGRKLPGPLIRFDVEIPVDVDFDLDLTLDSLRFHAEVLVPIGVTLKVAEPLTILWDITTPTEDQIQFQLSTDQRRSAMLQKVAGMEGELRRFLVRFVERELGKPHIQRAAHIELDRVIANAWPHLASQFLPNSPEDRMR